jgi:hypothetical protein
MGDLRTSLRSIRDLNVLPSTVLQNNQTAEYIAYIYVLESNKKRNIQKRKRVEHGKELLYDRKIQTGHNKKKNKE